MKTGEETDVRLPGTPLFSEAPSQHGMASQQRTLWLPVLSSLPAGGKNGSQQERKPTEQRDRGKSKDLQGLVGEGESYSCPGVHYMEGEEETV